MKVSLKQRAAFCILAMLLGYTQAFAQVAPPAGADNPLAKVLIEAEDMRIRLANIQVLSRYCKPPYEPNKSEAQFELDREALVLKNLLQDFVRAEHAFTTAGTTRLGMAFLASFPVINGMTPAAAGYWPAARAILTQVQNLLAKKQQQLKDAPERDCAPREAKQPPPKDPEPPSDPLAGLTRPTPRDITLPQIPAYFCSKDERTRFYLDNFASEWLEAAENVEDAAHYRAQVSSRGAAHFNNGGDPAEQRRLDAEERWADKNMTEHVRMRDRVDAVRDMILHTPIIDCSLISKNTSSDSDLLNFRAERIKNDIKSIDSRIKEIDRTIAEFESAIEDEIPPELDEAYERGLLEAEGQFGFDLAQWLKEVYKAEHRLERERNDLLWQKKVFEGELKQVNQLIEDTRRASAKPKDASRPAEEPREKVQEKRPSLLESLIPVFIPSFSLGIGGGKQRERERERR